MNVGIRIWITVALVAGWAILTIRFITLQRWPLALLSIVLLLMYGWRLYNLTKQR